MKFYHKKGTEVSTRTKSIYYQYTIVYSSNIEYLRDYQYFGRLLEKFSKNETHSGIVRRHHQTTKR